jgi:hypothetical protein
MNQKKMAYLLGGATHSAGEYWRASRPSGVCIERDHGRVEQGNKSTSATFAIQSINEY